MDHSIHKFNQKNSNDLFDLLKIKPNINVG